MASKKIHVFCFSATGATKQTSMAICEGVGIASVAKYDLLDREKWEMKPIEIPDDEIAIFGVPVYAGRIPVGVEEKLKNISGRKTPAIIACVYGNRDFDDALIELRDVVQCNGFIVIAAGAFLAQHSIFPNVAAGRPDAQDLQIAKTFGEQSMKLLLEKKDILALPNAINVIGNYPYQKVKSIPIKPKTNKRCNTCGMCARQCPQQAIHFSNSKNIDKQSCISCGHCIAICPRQAKYFGGLLYRIVSGKFEKKCAARKEPYIVFR